jgi:hypothetical protein
MDLEESVLYRMAYDLAADLAEADQDVLHGRWRSNPAAGGSGEQILADVLRRVQAADESGRVVVREAVDDALNRRRPRW